jgi:hypothetical protein
MRFVDGYRAPGKKREISLRRKAGRLGYSVRRSRRQLPVDNNGGYMLVDIESNSVAAGSRFELSLDGALRNIRYGAVATKR